MITRLLAAGALVAATLAAPAVAQTAADARFRTAQDRFDREYRLFQEELDRYQATRSGYRSDPYPPRVPDPRYDDRGAYDDGSAYYDPAPDYRSGNQYRERVLSRDERVYRGTDGRYYCRRGDGTTGLIAGGAVGGILGNVIDGGRSRVVGTLLGGAAGALAGREIDRNNTEIRCR